LTAYRIVWSAVAAAQRDKIDPSVRRRIFAKLDQAASDPLRYATRLAGSPYSRLRVGDWRVILEIDRGAIHILIIEVKHRRNAYQ
jgi:mRNA interferase RelE/StbE